MKENKLVEKLREVKPEMYQDIKGDPKKYMIFIRSCGLYTKKEATIICDFLRYELYKIDYHINR